MNRRHFILSATTAAVAAQGATQRTRVAIIGHTGRGNYGHGLDTMWQRLPELFEVVAVADGAPTGLADAKKRLGIEKGYSDYTHMLAEVKPEIVAIGPRHIDQHRDMIVAASKAGLRGIYIEKPFCRTLAEADEVTAACSQSNTKLAVAHRNRYQPVLATVKKLIDAGEIGRVLEYRARGKEDQRGGSEDMWVLGSHLFNVMHTLGGKPLSCSASIYQGGSLATKEHLKPGAEGLGPLLGDEIHAQFRFENGLCGRFTSIRSAGEKSAGFGVHIVGTKGLIDLRMDTNPTAQLLPGNPSSPSKGTKEWIPISTAGVGKPEPDPTIFAQVNDHRIAAIDLLEAIKANRQPLCSGEDARIVMEMTFGVFASHVANGSLVSLPLRSRSHPLEIWQ
ncbi:MAG: Gfo/Idh/MocA family oxidoreductase [Verrucomicrobiaceae bacterium]|nr:Gfo/Idh/MocA family oxidoreductase [Verrucomicrobiaceae bacterium]